MVRKTDDYYFKPSDKIIWWGTNLFSFITSLVLVISALILLPFRRRKSKVMNFAIKIAIACLVLFVVFGAYVYYSPCQTDSFGDQTRYIIVKRGDSVYDIAFNLQKIGAITTEHNFWLFSKFLGHTPKIKAGRYGIEPGYSLHDLFDMMTRGAAVPFNVTILEGLQIKEIADVLEKNLNLSRDEFITICSDRELLDSLGITTADNLEGYLFPDTYNFFYDESPRSVIIKMVAQLKNNLPENFEQKAKALGMSVHEAITLASLIEAEAMLDSERPIISAVYHNRLIQGYRLQCDPTVIYALGKDKKRLFYKDLEIDSPYNTYKHYGLPPGPICSPGKASLDAAVNPAAVDYLYFVAKGDGSHVFSRSNREHVNAKNRIKRSQMFNRD